MHPTSVGKHCGVRLLVTPDVMPERMKSVDLLERIEQILHDRNWSAAEWTRRAGLKEKSHLSTLIDRLRKNPKATLDLRTAAALADAAGISLDWLALGRGSQHGIVLLAQNDPVYPSRGIAVTAAKIFGYRPEAISKVLAVKSFPDDPGLDYWLALLKAEHAAGDKLLPAGPSRIQKRLPARKRG